MAVYSEVSAGEVAAKAINMHQDVAQFLALRASAVRALGSLRWSACLPDSAAVKRFAACRIFVDGQAGAD
ncbi:MAG: hypothetical protein CFE46_12610 [Burkholderiales bacterium PBB6]|nr:MAG: hypothetical protein CFE46_12610 [Burkholderiales bacterium PBB6]